MPNFPEMLEKPRNAGNAGNADRHPPAGRTSASPAFHAYPAYREFGVWAVRRSGQNEKRLPFGSLAFNENVLRIKFSDIVLATRRATCPMISKFKYNPSSHPLQDLFVGQRTYIDLNS
jgi:hypothetical protein